MISTASCVWIHKKLIILDYSTWEHVKVTKKVTMKLSTHPLRTPRTRLSMKKDPTTMSGMKNAQLNMFPMASFV